MGYIGLPTASSFATRGLKVVGVDVNERIVETLRMGHIHIQEPGLEALVQAAFHSGNLQVKAQPETADAFIICVPTPVRPDKSADLSYVVSAAASIVPHLRLGNLVVLESTSPPGTTAEVVRPILERSGLHAGPDFHLAYSPERVLPGQILKEIVENARVIGGIDAVSAQAGRDLYGTFVQGEIALTDATTAEMVKLMENTFRDVNIALANEFLRLGDRFGVDIWEAIRLANRHPRVRILQPGPGVGGHCVSVDPWFLVEAAPDISSLIRQARMVNDNQPAYVLELLRAELGDLTGATIGALGLTYKADIDDVRESPALRVVDLLGKAGARVRTYDPWAPADVLAAVRTRDVETCVQGADCVLLLVAHETLKRLDPGLVRPLVSQPLAIDCQHVWDRARWEAAGFSLRSLGVPKSQEANVR
jgi:UDP-N-acetyl-D-mannosaminuronic acid dehydrogenase